MIKFYKYEPIPELQEYVDSFFIISTGKYNDEPLVNKDMDKALRNHPQGTVDLMFVLRGPGIELTSADRNRLALSKVFLMAQQEGVFEINFLPDSFIFGIVFHGESFNKFLKLPLSELTNSGASILEELNQSYRDFYDKLSENTSHSFILSLANQFMYNQLGQMDFEFSKFDRLIQHIRLTNGKNSIDELSVVANMSKRSLQRKIKAALGVSPKSYSSTMRFRKAMKMIVNQPTQNWQDILFECDYFDQSHFIKDFKKFTGYTPTEFMREQLTLSGLFEGKKD